MAVAQSVLSETQRETLEALVRHVRPVGGVRHRRPGRARVPRPRRRSDMQVPRRSRGCWPRRCCPRRSPRSAACWTRSPRRASPRLPVEARTQIVHASATGPGRQARPAQLKALTLLLLLRAARRARPEPQLGGDRLSRARAPRRPRRREAPKTIDRGGGLGAVRHAQLRRLRGRLGRRRRGDRRRVRRRPASRCSCSRWARTATSRTSTSSRCRATRSCTTAAGLATSEDGSISILAGQTLGGGTVVNYMNCIRDAGADR